MNIYIDKEYLTGIAFFAALFGGIAVGCWLGMVVFG
jgi:hypothetical protein